MRRRSAPGSTSTRAELEQLGLGIFLEAGRLEIDDRERTRARDEAREHVAQNAERFGIVLRDRDARRSFHPAG